MKFERQFNSFYPILKQIATRFSRTTTVPYEEFESALCEEFYLKYGSFDKNKKDNFNAYMRVTLTQRALRVVSRKGMEFYRIEELYDGFAAEDGEGNIVDYISKIPDDFNLEEYLTGKEENKTDADKRQLINALTKNTDSITKAIVTEFLKGEHAKPTAIGNAIGIHHQTVKRKLKYLARNFDECEFGNIEAYLAV